MFDCVKGPLDKKIDKKIIWVDLNPKRNICYSNIISDIGFVMFRVNSLAELKLVVLNDTTEGKFLIITSGLLSG
jgi:hypothetical protein